MFTSLRAGLALSAALLATPALATPSVPTTFAQYVQANGAQQAWSIVTSTNNGVTTTTVSSAAQVYLTLTGVNGLPFAGPELSTLTVSASSSQLGNCGVACGNGDNFNEQGFSGTFSFIDNNAANGRNLLSGTFATNGQVATSGAQLSSNVGAGSASFKASATADNLQQLIFTSDYIAFVDATNETASFSLSSLVPNFAVGTITATNQAYIANGTLAAASSGTFSSDANLVALVPEPASMALLGVGIFAAGLLRRNRRG